MSTELQAALIASRLLTSREAAAALADGWRAEQENGPAVVNEMTVTTYCLRAAHVGAMEGEHWQQLAASTEEFAQNLRSVVGSPAECITIAGAAEHEFIVFRHSPTGRILGCMRVLPASDWRSEST